MAVAAVVMEAAVAVEDLAEAVEAAEIETAVVSEAVAAVASEVAVVVEAVVVEPPGLGTGLVRSKAVATTTLPGGTLVTSVRHQSPEVVVVAVASVGVEVVEAADMAVVVTEGAVVTDMVAEEVDTAGAETVTVAVP